MAALGYRPEIDGLRAVAVLPILLFHLDVEGLAGGFVGVDVFFVISGYLITRIVRRDVADQRFSFTRFYGRRIRRLFPALLAAIGGTLLLALLLMTPAALERTADAAVFATFSLANIQFWLSSGYFDEASGLKPLLHMWSLSVEEQFYLLWPALLWLTARRGGRWVTPVAIAGLGIASLIWSQHTLSVDPSMSFFFMPSRIFEFALGALMVWVPVSDRRPAVVREGAMALGLGAIVWSIATFDHDIAFPGAWALVPCVGTALAIWAGSTPRLGVLLNNRAFIWIGKLSYSLYLVHWPLIVFYKQAQYDALSWLDCGLLLAASFGAAYLLHRHVEQRFRHRPTEPGRWGPRGFALGTAGLTALLCVAAGGASTLDGLPGRYPARFQQLINQGDRVTLEDVETWDLGTCYLGGSYGKQHRFELFDEEHCLALDPSRKNVLLLGDSAAAHLIRGLRAVHGDEVNFLHASVASCRGFARTRRGNCRDLHRQVVGRWLPAHGEELDAVLIATRWEEEELLKWADELVDTVRAAGTRAVVIGPPAAFQTAPATVIASRYSPLVVRLQSVAGDTDLGSLRMPPSSVEEFATRMNGLLRPRVEARGATYISMFDSQCGPDGSCAATAPGPDGSLTLIHRDKLHFTPNGSLWAAAQLSVEELTGEATPGSRRR